ncbi:MAG: hypothetical protein N2441_06480 [Rhodocyclaceae bacterium]|nr:hypothetical protein [Rhodocyclaceae bacterium]
MKAYACWSPPKLPFGISSRTSSALQLDRALPTGLTDIDACFFGRWYAGTDWTQHAQKDLFLALAPLHAALHEAATRLCHAVSSEATQGLFRELESAAGRLIAQLQRCELALGRPSGESA